MRTIRISKSLLALSAAAGLAGLPACTTVQTTRPGIVGVQREQQMSAFLSSAEIRKSAAQAYDQVLSEARAKGTLDTRPHQLARVRAVARRLIAQTPTFRPDAREWPWEVHVIDSTEINAWAMPGGKIVVYSGLLDRLHLSDAELAAVLGHEIAHALREHGRERASQAVSQSMALQAAGAAGAGENTLDLARTVLNVTLTLPHSRRQETEADRIGVELAARAGYDPRAAVTLWQKMADVSGSAPPEFLSTHPSRATREHDLQVYAARVMPLYQAARAPLTGLRCGHGAACFTLTSPCGRRITVAPELA